MIKLRHITLFIIATAITSCVPLRKLEDEKAKRENCEKELSALKSSSQECETRSAEMKIKLEDYEKSITVLKRDTGITGKDYRTLVSRYDKLNSINESLQDRLNKLLKAEEADTKRMAGQLSSTQEELVKKQDELRKMESELNAKKTKLDELTVELQKREARVNELEAILKKKDDAVNDLKKKVTDALLGFENKGLTITQKNGKVYVSMDESLLFASGSTKVEARGVEAIKKLAKVLEQNSDINIMVEGHTDDQPMNGKGDIKDNWDLSVMRATSVVKIITNNSSTDPKRVSAAGRGEYFPLDPGKSAEARKKNRRTEIILTPKLDELFKMLESN